MNMPQNWEAWPSHPPWLREDIKQKCFDRLEGTNGPVVYNSREVQVYDPDMGLVIPKKSLCVIEMMNYTKKSIFYGLGCYYGSGHVLTALHVIENAAEEEIKILIYFPAGYNMLVYKAEFTKYCNFDIDRDQAFIKLSGDTSPLGDGLQDQIGEAIETGSVCFYTLTPGVNFQKQEGKICRPNLNMKDQMCTDECIISVAGKPGDSGSPVYNNKDELIGIYRGSFTFPGSPEYGRFTKISPQFIPWVQRKFCRSMDFFFGLCKKCTTVLISIFQQKCCGAFCNVTPDLKTMDSCLVDIE